MMRLLLAFLLCWAAPGAAQQVAVRVGSHPGFGRVVFDVPPATEFEVVEEANRVLVVFTGAPAIPAPPTLPRNVVSLNAGVGSATLVFRPGTRVRASRMGQRIVVDAYDPAGAAPPRSATARRPMPPPARSEAAVTAAPTVPGALPASVPAAASAPAPAAPIPLLDVTPAPVVPVQAAPVPPAAAPAAQDPPASRPAVPGSTLLPVATDVGAAVFTHGDQAVVVLDGQMSGAAPGNATIVDGPEATVVSLPLPPGTTPRLTRTAQGWAVAFTSAGADAEMVGAAGPGALGPGVFNVAAPGRSVTVLQPGTRQTLLVGTTRQPAAGGLAAQRTPAYAVLPTVLGVAVEPFSDQVRLVASLGGFRLEPASPAPAVPSAAAMAKLFDFSSLPVPAQLNRLQAQIAAAASAPPRARGPARWAVAQTMVSLGMAAEASAVLVALAAENPDMAGRAEVRALAAAAAVLSHRLDEAAGLDDVRLDAPGELGLWRGVRMAWQGRERDAAAVLPQALPWVLDYPPALRDRLLPTVLEVMAEHGDGGAKAALANHPGPAFDYARALQAERDGETETALAALDRLAASRDFRMQARADVRRSELRLRTGTLTPAGAADALDKQVLAWRGDGREVALRLRVAELRATAGLWRPALDGLRDAARVAGEGPGAGPVAARMEAVFHAMLAPGASPVAPLDLVTLASEYADQLPGGPDGMALRLMLASKLGTLDLPVRAQGVVRPLMLGAAPGPLRAGLGALLAQSLLDSGDPAAAGAALAQSEAGSLPPSLQDQRGLLLARVQSLDGRVPAAIATLAALATPAAHELRARLLDQSGDRAGALGALADLGRTLIPAAGALDGPMQDLVLRQASAAVQAGDDRALQGLRKAYLPRMQPPRLDLFRVLTTAPLAGSDDLPRAGADVALARNLPRGLQALTGR